jgi:hypothetical protein
LDGVIYHGARIAVVWDRDGRRYGLSAGFHVLINGRIASSQRQLRKVKIKLALFL